MTDNVLRIPTGQLRLSRIVYLTDLLHSDSREIAIGVIAEVRVQELTGIAAALRPSLTQKELSKVGPAARKLLKRPLEGLWPHIKAAFAAAPPGAALDELSSKFASSLSVLSAKPLEIPRKWLLRPADTIQDAIANELRALVEREYFDFLFPNSDVPDPAIDEQFEVERIPAIA